MKKRLFKSQSLLAMLVGTFVALSCPAAAAHKRDHHIEKEISDIHSDVKHCCHHLNCHLDEIFELLDDAFVCDGYQVIDSVPVTISTPGKYCVTEDLIYSGSGAAITVTADDVSINFHNHSLTLISNQAEGILVQEVREFTLENDIIKGGNIFRTATSAAIHLKEVTKATLRNLYTRNTTKGIFIEDSSDVLVVNCLLENHESSDFDPPAVNPAPQIGLNSANGAAIWIEDSSGISVEGCDFQAAELEYNPDRVNVAFHVRGVSENIDLKNSTFSEWHSSINVLRVNNFLIDQCEVKANTDSNMHAIQLGDCIEDNAANGIVIQNTNIKKYPTEVPNFDGILLVQGAGCLIDNVTCQPSSFQYNNYPAAALHVGLFDCAGYHDVLVKDSIFGGVGATAIELESARNVTVENCQLNSFGTVVELRDAGGCVVKNCIISSGDIGVHLNNTTGQNSVIGCQVRNFNNYGILVSETEGGIPNHISDNSVYWCETGIAIPVGSYTEVFHNTACNNDLDCENPNGVFFIAQSPGDSPVAAGWNVCCSTNEN